MWQLRWFIFIICLICTLQAVPAEANRVDDTEPPKVNRKNDAEECIWSTLDLFWRGKLKTIKRMNAFARLKEDCDEYRGHEGESDPTTEDWLEFLQAGSSRCFEQNCYETKWFAREDHCAELCEFLWNKPPEQVPEGGWSPMPIVKQVWGSLSRYMGSGSLRKTAPVSPLPVSPAGGFRFGPR